MVFPFLLLLLCTYYVVNHNFNSSENLFLPKLQFLFFPIGILISVLTLILEVLIFDSQLSNNSAIALLFGFSLLVNGKNLTNQWVENFSLVFFAFLFIFSICVFLSKLIYKDPSHSYGLFNDSAVVEFFLVKPVLFFLTIMSLNAWNIGNRIFFEDLEYNLVSSVGIAESCSGIYSVIFYLSAFFSFYIVEERSKNFIDTFFYFLVLL